MAALTAQRAARQPLALVCGLAATFVALSISAIAHQDMGSYIALRAGAEQSWRRHVAAQVSPNLRQASFAFMRPTAREDFPTAIVHARLSAPGTDFLDPRRAPTEGVRLAVGAGAGRAVVFPEVNREAKGDLLATRARLRGAISRAPEGAVLFGPPNTLAAASSFVRRPWSEPIANADLPMPDFQPAFQLVSAPPAARIDDRAMVERLGLIGPAFPGADPIHPEGPLADGPGGAPLAADTAEEDDMLLEASRFPSSLPEDQAGIVVAGDGLIGQAGAGVGAPPIPVEQQPFRVRAHHDAVRGFDPMLDGLSTDKRGDRADPVLAGLLQAAPPATITLDLAPGMSRYARPEAHAGHPVHQLALAGRAFERAHKCLAEAVYWEARGEPERGQIGVAQVVLNRAVSGFYPRDICGVVYQNAHRYLACQFTFACEGRRSLVPTEAGPWALARRVAADMLYGRAWLPDVGHATHYHANYVRPWWARSMNRLQTIGVHIFYRPRNWGSGES